MQLIGHIVIDLVLQSVECNTDSTRQPSSNRPPLPKPPLPLLFPNCTAGTASFNMVSDRLEDNTLMLVLPIDEKRWVRPSRYDIDITN